MTDGQTDPMEVLGITKFRGGMVHSGKSAILLPSQEAFGCVHYFEQHHENSHMARTHLSLVSTLPMILTNTLLSPSLKNILNRLSC